MRTISILSHLGKRLMIEWCWGSFSSFVLCPVRLSPSQQFLSRHATLIPNKLTEERYVTKQKRLRGRLAVQQLQICYFCYSKLFQWPNNLAPFFSQSEGTPPQSMKLQEQDITLLVKRNVIGSFEPLRIWLGRLDLFHMTLQRPFWCPKTIKRWPCLVLETKPVEVELFLIWMLSFVKINLHRCWPLVWKRSTVNFILVLQNSLENFSNGS